jgi:hypothetical protein
MILHVTNLLFYILHFCKLKYPKNNTDKSVHNFYQNFVIAKGKPLMFPETGAPWYTTYTRQPVPGTPASSKELDIKRAWWVQVFGTNRTTLFPGLIAAVNFEETKTVDGYLKDWSVVNRTETAAMFNSLLGTYDGTLVQGTRFKYACDGSVTLN